MSAQTLTEKMSAETDRNNWGANQTQAVVDQQLVGQQIADSSKMIPYNSVPYQHEEEKKNIEAVQREEFSSLPGLNPEILNHIRDFVVLFEPSDDPSPVSREFIESGIILIYEALRILPPTLTFKRFLCRAFHRELSECMILSQPTLEKARAAVNQWVRLSLDEY